MHLVLPLFPDAPIPALEETEEDQWN
jgi:hypothetical protein